MSPPTMTTNTNGNRLMTRAAARGDPPVRDATSTFPRRELRGDLLGEAILGRIGQRCGGEPAVSIVVIGDIPLCHRSPCRANHGDRPPADFVGRHHATSGSARSGVSPVARPVFHLGASRRPIA